jgi:hypothetical protein
MKRVLLIFSFISNRFTNPAINFREYKIILLLLGLTGMALSLVSTSLYGAGLSPDSVYYISTARNLIAGKGFISYMGIPIVEWPPLYPIILAIPSIFIKIDPLISAPYISAILFGMTIYFSGLLLCRHLDSSFAYSLTGVTLLLISNVLLDLYTMAWSETLFVFLVILSLVFLEKFIEKEDKFSFIVFSLSVALTCLTRYIGVCLIITGVLTILLISRSKFKVRLYYISAFIFISALPTGIWNIRNLIISGTIGGGRDPSVYTLTQNIVFTFKTIYNWGYFPPKNGHGNFFLFILIILLIGSVVGFIIKGGLQKLGRRTLKIMPVTLFFVIYISFLIYTSTSYKFDQINWRLLVPIYIPATLLFLFIIDLLLDPIREIISPLVTNALLVTVMWIWLFSYPYSGSKHYIHNWMVWGTAGFNNSEWRNSETIKYLQKHPLDSGRSIYSNEIDVLYILFNIDCKKEKVNIIPMSDDQKRIRTINLSEWGKNGYDYFVYFDKIDPRSYPYTKDQLENSINVIKIVKLSDGVVYAVKRIL